MNSDVHLNEHQRHLAVVALMDPIVFCLRITVHPSFLSMKKSGECVRQRACLCRTRWVRNKSRTHLTRRAGVDRSLAGPGGCCGLRYPRVFFAPACNIARSAYFLISIRDDLWMEERRRP